MNKNTEKTLKKMPLEDKVAFGSGKDMWNTKPFPEFDIPSVWMSDGPTGLRKQIGTGDNLGLAESEKATCFPVAGFIACSFDKKLVADMSAAIAEEAGASGVAMILAPGVNIKRNPLCGRNFEYFSEDPYLAGKLGAAFILASEAKGIGTSLKHFACNSQEYFRMISDSLIDERTLRELYLANFEHAVKEGNPSSVMCAYNRVNGTYCSDNKYLLTDILREEWGFSGFVVTDWGALNDRAKAFEAGCDLVMPGGSAAGEKVVIKSILNGDLSEGFIDQSAERILRFVNKSTETLKGKVFSADLEKHHGLAERTAEGCAVLLKNDEGLLPCKAEDIVIIGRMAENIRIQGFGSSRVNPYKTDNVLSFLPGIPYAPGYDEEGGTTDELVRQAVDLIQPGKTAVIIAGLPDSYEAEGIDRTDMKLPEGQDRLISEITKISQDVAVVLVCGCPVETPWAGEVKSILYMGLPGQAGAGALVNLITGKANPSGRLPETWPVRYEDCPSASFYGNGMRNAEYREGIYVGYRYYEKAGKEVRFSFGEGLSYTTFAYSDLKLNDKDSTGDRDISFISKTASITVTNTGDRYGGEAVLLFVHAPQDGIHRPLRELKGFDKVFLEPGERKEVSFELDTRSFAVWDGGWKVYAGEYMVQVGDCFLEFYVDGEKPDGVWYRTLRGPASREEWVEQLGYTPREERLRPFTVNSAITDAAKYSLLIRVIQWFFKRLAAKEYGKDSVNYRIMIRGAEESPLRIIRDMVKTKGDATQALVDFANKKFFKGLWHLFR